ncbi:hypothetical protein AB0J40_10490 [Amycolatopsis sp. NPDC049691]|uniref:hypothetical protein n=1 Tax=Amycolatopsis sp. NPDC049691 TaxID=3155155 RepID=UPI0034218290
MASESGISELPLRFKLVNAVPAALVVTTAGALILGGAPQRPPSFDVLVARAQAANWFGAVGAIALLAIGALLLEPFELNSIRVLEGYWSTAGPLGRLARFGRWLHERRRSRLQFLAKMHPELVEEGIDDEIQTRWPQAWPLLPTALGNRLRAFEEQAGSAYQLDTIELWPRLYYALPESALGTVNGYRTQLDVASRLSLSLLTSALIAAGLLFAHGWWLTLPAVLVLSSWLAYRAALAAAGNYCVAVRAVIDVYRLKLLQAMQLKMPANLGEEQVINEALSRVWRGDPAADLTYAPAEPGRVTPS